MDNTLQTKHSFAIEALAAFFSKFKSSQELPRRSPTWLGVCSHFRMARAPLLEARRALFPVLAHTVVPPRVRKWLCGEVTQYRLWRELEPRCGVAWAPRLRKVGTSRRGRVPCRRLSKSRPPWTAEAAGGS